MQNKIFTIPDWMTSSSEYCPLNDNERFINKSIKSFLTMLSKIKGNVAVSNIILPEIKIAFTLISTVLVSISHNIAFTYFIFGICVFHMVFMDGNCIKSIIRAGLIACLFSFLFLLPSLFLDNNKNILLIVFKILTSIVLISILTHNTNWNQLTKALRSFHIPALFIFLLDITLKYICLLGDTCLSLLDALKLRSVGVNSSKEKSTSGILGIVYLKSREMSIETYDAMICRCFDGEYNNLTTNNNHTINIKTICLNICYSLLIFTVLFMFFGPLK